MDHAIDSLRPYLEAEFDMFLEEWKSGKYKKFSDCPSYYAVKALIDATNCMHKYMGWQNLRLKDMVENYL